MKKIYKTFFAVLAASILFSSSAYADSVLMEGSVGLNVSDDTVINTTYSVSIESDDKSFELIPIKTCNPDEDGLYNETCAVHANPGDTITLSVTSDTAGTYIGTTIMPFVDGKWIPGTANTIVAGTDGSMTAVTDFEIGPNDSRVKLALQNHPSMFTSKKPGCFDLTIDVYVGDTPIPEASAKKETGLFSSPISIAFIAILSLLIIYSVLKKVAAHRNKR